MSPLQDDHWSRMIPTILFSVLQSPDSDPDFRDLLNINQSLELGKCTSLEDLLSTFLDVFSESFGCSDTLRHYILLTYHQQN